MPNSIVQIEGVGNVEFPASMSDADIGQAAHRLYTGAVAQKIAANPPGVPKPDFESPLRSAIHDTQVAPMAGVPGGSSSPQPASDRYAATVGLPVAAAATIMGGSTAIPAIARVAVKHPVIASTIGSELIHQARNIPYVGRMIPPYSEMLPYLLGGGKGEAKPEAAPETILGNTDQIPGRPYMPNPRYERPVPEELPARRGPLLLSGETAPAAITNIMHGPEAPPPEVLQARGLATGGRTIENPSAGLGRIPVRTPAPASAILSPIEATPAPRTAATPKAVEEALNESLGGQPLVRGVSLRNQPAAQAAAAGKLPEGFTPVKSSVLRGYKYDPETQQFDSITNDGRHYVHGDVSPEQFKTFEAAESKGKAWPILRGNATPVAKGQVGNPQPIPKASVSATPEGEVSPLSQKVANLKDFIKPTPAKAAARPVAGNATPEGEDLTSLLQQSVDQAGGKGGVFTSASPKDLLDRWGVDPESFAEGRSQTRGMSSEESAASIDQLAAAYKKGQTIEPVIETRDAANNIVDVDGRGRALAAHKAGIKRIPIIVRRTQ